MDLEGTLKNLKSEVGSTPEIKLEKFQNWGRTQKAELLITTPTAVEEVQSVIKAAKKLKLKVVFTM